MVEKTVEKVEERAEEKMVDSKNIILGVKSIHRFFYLNTILLIVVCLLPYMIHYIYPDIPYVEILAISTIMLTVVMIFYIIIMRLLSSVVIASPSSLAEKMMSCKLRIKNGLDYCVKCPDGYTCASGK